MLVLIAALHLPPQAPPASPVFKAGVVAVIAAAVADVVTTHQGLARGAHEANPAMRPFARSTVGMVAIKAAGTAGVIWSANELRKLGHPRWATGLVWAVTGLWGSVAVWNATR